MILQNVFFPTKVKDHSKTGKDEHLGSFAARINDIQEGESEHFETMKIFILEFFFIFQVIDGLSSATIREKN